MGTDLLSFPSLVESPFIIVKIGDYTFGSYTRSGSISRFGGSANVTYPNFMKSLNIVKINGTVNTYSIRMEYAIKQGDDPNLLDKVFSTVADTRKITLSYGDWASPSYIYREETAIITKVVSNVDFNGSKISYTISCTSDSLSLTANKYSFPKRVMKPSDGIKELLYNKKYGMTDVFYGMTDKNAVANNNIIASDDKAVVVEAKTSVNPLEYLNYLVSCMTPINNVSKDSPDSAKYMVNAVDDTKGKLGGPYFKVTKVESNPTAVDSLDTFTIDVGYPGDNFVTNFSIRDDQSWAILYKYADKINTANYQYRINDAGQLVTEYTPSVANNSKLMRNTSSTSTWWNNMTQFPISATITIKGLLRPAILMSYVRVNAYFFGQKHVSSGLYIITRQEDSIDSSGYKTTLNLLRIGADS